MAKAPAKKEAAKKEAENEFDPRRETLVMETKTSFPADSKLSDDQRSQVTAALHADPKSAGQLQYVRCPTGFIRHITVTAGDLARIGK